MYTYNLFVFGHDVSKDKEINNLIWECDLEFRKTINGKKFEVSFPYHGGIVKGDTYAVLFGVYITDDDHNSNYVSEVRNAKEEDYINDYNQFLKEFIDNLTDFENGLAGTEDETDLKPLLDYLNNTKPEFYNLQVSS